MTEVPQQVALFEPPYTAVIFSSLRKEPTASHDYEATAKQMSELAEQQPGYLGVEAARDGDSGFGITVSYWRDASYAAKWKQVAEHLVAQKLGRDVFYKYYTTRVATVEREYGFNDESGDGGTRAL